MSTKADRIIATSGSMRRTDLDAFKGILICLIVLGHNNYFSQFFNYGFALLYNFHVISFLLLPFLFRYEQMHKAAYLDRMSRTLVPQFWFLLVTIPLYFVMFVMGQPEATHKWLTQLPLALVLQNETALNAVSGFRHFWFLPAMAIMISFLCLIDRVRSWQLGLLVTAAALWHFSAGEINIESLRYLPWGSAIVSFILFPGFIVRAISKYSDEYWKAVPISVDSLLLLSWLALTWLVLEHRLFMPLAGDPYGLLSGLQHPSRLLFQDLFLLISFFALLRLGWWLSGTFFVALGRESLKIFLLAPLIWQVFWIVGGNSLTATTTTGNLLLISPSFIATLTLSYAFAKGITITSFKQLLFPKRINFKN